ncbi:MAG: aldehyde dehydrogenase family protein [Magnetospirillum sp.]|nr:aldehyde dehydrogenase family protein [Magnetospirillum sp.]
MTDCLDFYIDGAWVKPVRGGKALDVVNPATETVSGRVALGGADDAVRAIEAASRACPAWAATPLSQRIELLAAVTAGFERRLDEIADAITDFKTALSVAKSYAFERKQGSTLVVKEPVGVVSLITPWNWPMNQVACKVVPALVTGCAMVLKPSEFAPFSARLLAEIIHEAGVPAGVFNMIFGEGPEIGPVMSSHPLVDMVSLTGSNGAGSSVMREAAATIKKVSLELGGKSANLILASADFKRAVGHGVKLMMNNTGQSCNAPSRMFVPAERLEEAEILAAEICAGIKVGDPRDPETVMGPIANVRQFERVRSLIRQGMDEGARLVCGGSERPDGLDKGYFVRPTVFSGVTDQMSIARQEIFGPVLCLRPYKDLDDAVRGANDCDYGLSGYVYAGDLDEARAVARRLRTGMVHLNGALSHPGGPFGGIKQSGVGREWGEAGFEEFLESKTLFGSDPAPKS